MASVGYAIPSTLHFVVLCCAPLLRAHLVHIVTPQNTAPAPTTTTPPTTPDAPDTFLTAYHHAQTLRSAPDDRNDFYDPSDNDTYNTLIHSSHIPSEYPSLTHHFLPYAPPPPSPLPHHPPHHHLSCHPTPYSAPSAPSAPLLGFLPAKLSLKLLLKILLKLLLFKMVVKVIAVVCFLWFVPLLKPKGTAADAAAEDGRALQLASLSEMVWDSLEEKNWMYGDDQDMKDMREIAEQADADEEEEDGLSGPLKAVKFLEFCVSTVDRLVGYVLGVLQRQRNDQENDLSSFVLEKLSDFLGQCLKLIDLRVPQVVDVRDDAILKCKFDLGGDELYSVKWYKEELEFFRYMPDNSPKVQTFSVEGVHVVESRSNVTVITLSPLEYRSSGVYRCEVSSERPHFKTVYKSENMSVLGLPRGGPTIEGIKDTYFLGDYVTGNCTSSPSNPAAQIQWFINEKKAEDWFLEYYNPPKKKEELNLESRVLGLRFQVDLTHYQGKNQLLSLTCQSTVAGKTKTQRVNVHLSRMMTNQKFAQEQTNRGNGGGRPAAFFVLLLSHLCFTARVHFSCDRL